MDVFHHGGDVLRFGVLRIHGLGLAERFDRLAQEVAFHGGLGHKEELEDTAVVIIEVLVGVGIHGIAGFRTLLLGSSENLLFLQEEFDLLLGLARQDVPGRLVIRIDVRFGQGDPGSRLGGFLGVSGCGLGLVHGLLRIGCGFGLGTDHRQREDERQCDENLLHNFFRLDY